MKKAIPFLVLVIFGAPSLFLGRDSIASQEKISLSNEEYVANEVLVKFKDDLRKPFIQTAIESVQGMVITHEKNVITASEWDAVTRSNLSFIDVPYLVHLKVPESI